jgi:hypothetical protein
LSEIALALVYFDVASQSEVELRQVFAAEELEEVLAQRCEAFLAWALQEATHRDARDAALTALGFPQVAGVNYPGRPATTILAGGGGGIY